jgi:hypothetical protein
MKQKSAIYLNFVSAALWYIAAAIGYFNNNSMATVWLCLGSMWLCFGAVALKKSKTTNEENKDENENKPEE